MSESENEWVVLVAVVLLLTSNTIDCGRYNHNYLRLALFIIDRTLGGWRVPCFAPQAQGDSLECKVRHFGRLLLIMCIRPNIGVNTISTLYHFNFFNSLEIKRNYYCASPSALLTYQLLQNVVWSIKNVHVSLINLEWHCCRCFTQRHFFRQNASCRHTITTEMFFLPFLMSKGMMNFWLG